MLTEIIMMKKETITGTYESLFIMKNRTFIRATDDICICKN